MIIKIDPTTILTDDFEINIAGITIEGASEAFTEKFGQFIDKIEVEAHVEALCKRLVPELLPKRGIDITEAYKKD